MDFTKQLMYLDDFKVVKKKLTELKGKSSSFSAKDPRGFWLKSENEPLFLFLSSFFFLSPEKKLMAATDNRRMLAAGDGLSTFSAPASISAFALNEEIWFHDIGKINNYNKSGG